MHSPVPDRDPAASLEPGLLSAVFDTAGSVIIALRPDYTIFAWNRAAERLYQTPRALAIGMDFVTSFLAPEHQDAVRADIREVLAGKTTINFEDDSVLPDGTRRTLLWNVSRVLDADGTSAGIVAAGQDISERKEADERFRLIFEHADDGLLLSDHTGVIDCNPSALRMLGLQEKAQLIGRRPAEFSPTLQPDGVPSDQKSRAIGALTLKYGAYTFDWVHQQPDGTGVPVEVSVRHAMLSGRRVSVSSWRDQSRRIELDRERALVQQRLDQAQKMEAVGQLAGGVAHDFNNLLAAIRNAIELAISAVPLEHDAQRDLDLALQTADRASGLTRQLLAFSRRQPRVVESVDLAALIRELRPLLRASLPSAVTMQIDCDTAGACVVADRSQLEQVVLNLVLNARDAMPDGGRLAVTVKVDHGRGQTLLAVSDSGMGMDDNTKQRIFEPFYTTKPVGKGTGLGLAVVYGVVTQAGGTVRADSTLGEGTAIHVALPLCREAPGTPALLPSVSHAPGLVVLLVDDDHAVRSTTRRLLERARFTVIDAPGAAEALALFDTHRDTIAVLLTDIRMPDMDGVQLARAVRAQVPDFPVVFFSGYDEVAQGGDAEISNIPLLAKPYASEELCTMLRAAVTARAGFS